MKTGAKNFSWLDVPKSIWYFLAEDNKKFIFLFSALSLTYLYDFVPAYIVGKMVDFFTSYTGKEPLFIFYFYVVFIAATWVLVALLRLKCQNLLGHIRQHIRTRVRILGFERLTEFSLGWHNKENTGNKLQRIFTGADALANFVRLFQRDLVRIFVSILGTTGFFLFTDFRFAITVAAYVAIFLWIEFSFSKKVLDLSDEFNKFNQKAGGTYVESASNMLSIKALGGEGATLERVAGIEKFSRSISIRKIDTLNLKWRFIQLLNGVALGAFLYLIGMAVVEGYITAGKFLTFFTYFYMLQRYMADISNLHMDAIELRSDTGNMMPIFRETEFIKRGNDIFPKNWGKIEFDNVSMEYGSGQVGLEGFNLVLKRNTKTGVAGSSGSGKSTLAKVVLGLYSLKSGSFKIGNKDYYSISHNETLSRITVVLQETELFNLSLRDNITMMREGDEELLNLAIEVSELKPVIDKLPQGLDSMIGEKGYMLSGGERQRLGIARAIYKNAPIIILDEATSSLDSETERKIMAKLFGDYGNDKTFLIIAHRLGTLKYTDNIAVMAQGRIIEEGSYYRLMNNSNSLFYKMNTAPTPEERESA